MTITHTQLRGYLSIYWLLIFFGRLVGVKYLKNSKQVFAIVSVCFIVIVMLITGVFVNNLTILMLVLCGLTNSILFPVIFSLGFYFNTYKSIELLGLILTTICGVAFVPLITGSIVDATKIYSSIVVCAVCYGLLIVSCLYLNCQNKQLKNR